MEYKDALNMEQERMMYYEENCKLIDYEIARIKKEIRVLRERESRMIALKEELQSNMQRISEQNHPKILKK